MTLTKIISFIFVLLAVLFSIWIAVHNIKKSESFYEKILNVLWLFIYSVPAIIFLFDVYNIPSVLKYTEKIDSVKWFNFISTYASTMAGSIVSGVILLLITFWQIKKQTENNNDNKRIQNAPIMKYIITNEAIQNCKDFYILNDEGPTYNLFFNIENIGLNHARNLKIDLIIENDNINREYFIDNNQSIIKRNENISIDMIFNFKYTQENNHNKNVKIIVYYDDLLNNRYKQLIELSLEFTNLSSSKYQGRKIEIKNIIINNEEQIKEDRK